jgi:hypothetical protein
VWFQVVRSVLSTQTMPTILINTNYIFKDPEHTALPTAGAFASIEVSEDVKQLFFSEGDVCDAFHHVGLPDGLGEVFVLPAIPAYLVGILSIDGVDIGPNDLVSPSLAVLPMGWSRSVYFMQDILETAADRAGLDPRDRVREKHPSPRSPPPLSAMPSMLIII